MYSTKLYVVLERRYGIIRLAGRVCFQCHVKDAPDCLFVRPDPLCAVQTLHMTAGFDFSSICTKTLNEFWQNLVLRLRLKYFWNFIMDHVDYTCSLPGVKIGLKKLIFLLKEFVVKTLAILCNIKTGFAKICNL
jgi:hypothetical protein